MSIARDAMITAAWRGRIRRSFPFIRLLIAGLIALQVALLAAAGSAGAATATWTVAGQGPADNRSQPDETAITPGNVNTLRPKWAFTTHGDVTATPTVADGRVYFPDGKGYLYAVDERNGALIWQKKISDYVGGSAMISRVSPAVYFNPRIGGNELILGDNEALAPHPTGATMFGVDARTGALLWKTQVDSHEAAMITGSPTIAGNEAIVGVSSNEELLATANAYTCCTFRGSVVALDPLTGKILWKTYTVPPNSGPCKTADPEHGCGYSGGAVWSSPAYDPDTGDLYVATGNNYTTPDLATYCESLTRFLGKSDDICTRTDDYFDAVIALNASNGKVLWGHKVQGWDASTIACGIRGPGVTWCPTAVSPDWDMGSGPNIITATGTDGRPVKLVGAGQKSGVYWAFDPETGAVVWHALLGPGSNLGGVMWGTAFDGTRVYAQDSNQFATPFKLPNGTSIRNGAWAALDPVTGALDWETQVPARAKALGPPSAANGVVFWGSSAPRGDNMFALDGATGRILWSYASGGSTISSPAIVDGNVFWGSGYRHLAPLGYSGNNKLYDFTLNGS